MNQYPVETMALLAQHLANHPELLHADRLAEREGSPRLQRREVLARRLRRAYYRAARRLRAARAGLALSGRAA
ncbi:MULTISPECIES: hypothetical protein [Demequina]|uniref:Uncharacterized protein n=1 Tax=Demequina litorisediminis TaxID=1849022 RepID=A0ABQ6IJK4_9MICO|nr:hypothetical protein [Demequina litorisediminis]GMA37303.1 hypothetical protein GCM10025876_35070 [Demequina litorisediminis]